MTPPTFWLSLWRKSKGIWELMDLFGQPLELWNAQGQATSDWSSIVPARLTTDQQNVFEFEFVAGGTNPTGPRKVAWCR